MKVADKEVYLFDEDSTKEVNDIIDKNQEGLEFLLSIESMKFKEPCWLVSKS